MRTLFSPKPVAQEAIIFLLRVIVAALLIYHGAEVFDAAKMKGYTEWEQFKNGPLLPYAGKGAEFAAGLLLLTGLLTRIASSIIIVTFVYITFFIGGGKFWYEDQHPFMFALFGLLFLFTGPGWLSLDALFFTSKETDKI